MKKIFGVLLVVFSLNVMGADVKVKVSGMVCSMCAQGIQKKFSSEKAVKKLDVDLDSKIVSIETHEGQDISDDTIKELIKKAGYNVAEIVRE